jgi:EAL domain-containing protein (putative c-di-GMP-specific phosphodiesterase class I)
MPYVDGTELVTPVTQWVLREALTEARAWHDAGLPLDIAVNLSALSLQDVEFVGTVTDLLRATALPPIRLQLEITESTIMTSRADGALQELAALGVRFSIDDFGTGYSSLSYLSRLPVDIIKIDRSFITDMTTNVTSEAIVRSILQLSHSLGCRVVAEGVETVEVLDALRRMGCDFAQGFYFSRAVPGSEFTKWVREHPAAGRDRGSAKVA